MKQVKIFIFVLGSFVLMGCIVMISLTNINNSKREVEFKDSREYVSPNNIKKTKSDTKLKEQREILLACLEHELIPRFGIAEISTAEESDNRLYLKKESNQDDEVMNISATGIYDVFIDDYDNDESLEMFVILVQKYVWVGGTADYSFEIYEYVVLNDENTNREFSLRPYLIHYSEQYDVNGKDVVGCIIGSDGLGYNCCMNSFFNYRMYLVNDNEGVYFVLEKESSDEKNYLQYAWANWEDELIGSEETVKLPSMLEAVVGYRMLERGIETNIEESVMRLTSNNRITGDETIYIHDYPENAVPLYVYPYEYESAKEQFYQDMKEYNMGKYADNSNRKLLFELNRICNFDESIEYIYISSNEADYLSQYMVGTLNSVESGF